MRRVLLGGLLLLHGLAHAGPALWAPYRAHSWLLAGLGHPVLRWVAAVAGAVALAGFWLTGLGVLGAGPLARRWRGGAATAAAASLLLLTFWPSRLALPGALLDVGLLAALGAGRVLPRRAPARRPHPARARAVPVLKEARS